MKEQLIENIDYVICQICKDKKESIAGPHLKRKHKISSDDYKKMFPGYSVISEKYGNKVSPKGREDHHMKRPEMRKLFSEKFKGENNLNSKKNSTELQRKERSPRNIEFYKKRFPDNYEEEFKNYCDRLKVSLKKGKPSSNKIEYWNNLGFSDEEALIKLKDRQNTFSLEKCIEKHGEKIGREKFDERQRKWHLNYTKSSYSKISQELFIKIFEKLSFSEKEIVRFATILYGEIVNDNRNYEMCVRTKSGNFFPDFVLNKKIIEFDGVYYHKNTPENKKREEIRDNKLINEGYKVLHIREDEYRKDKESIIQKCLDFLNENNETI